ncbi:acyl-coenzyme A thioesterase 13-like [Panicum miliaceum]|uniref:Acyl-coenzyme A thioesterase 13-like n=1 Tax=Panicum miliaceum TaxID=4540 RepID=A0A3L6SNR6_PANMI|nr:acyl-coenzyme A thioesterase 13-like [Panicum miliaceum]
MAGARVSLAKPGRVVCLLCVPYLPSASARPCAEHSGLGRRAQDAEGRWHAGAIAAAVFTVECADGQRPLELVALSYF